MCVKELRETLRDRRTLFTLVLMPLLVYPLLSMALQRLILTSTSSSSTENYLVGVSSDSEMEQLGSTIIAAQRAIEAKAYRPFRIERPTNQGQRATAKDTLATWRVAVIEQNMDAQLEAGNVELAVRIDQGAKSDSETVTNKSIPIASRRFEVHFRQHDGRSEAALSALTRLLQAINDQQALELRQQLGMERAAAVELSATAIDHTPSLISSIASVIPLILLLMTITGAVYPAIDLTAGERERGTMEALISTPVPRFALLLSKYVAVVSVSILTALINLLGMSVTLSVGGLGRAILGDEQFPWYALVQIFPLLVLFSGFFSAILLALCCVAKSFKEAQAYLIPVMLLALGPGVLSVLPGVNLTPNMAVVPLLNMILLARDVLAGTFQWLPASITVVSTILYSIAVMAVAAQVFGRHAMVQQSQESWKYGWHRSVQRNKPPSLSELSIFLAMFFPVYFVATNTIGVAENISLSNRLWIKAGLTCVLFGGLPIAFAWWRGLSLQRTFGLAGNRRRLFLSIPALLLLAGSLWTLAHEVFVFSEWLGIASLRPEQLAAANETKSALQRLPLLLIWLTMAIVPAVAEETFFRGFAFRAMQTAMKPGVAVVASAFLFGAFHVVAGSILSIERFLPTAALGGVLGWLAWRTGSLIPGILVHAGHNGLLFTIARYEESLRQAGWGIHDQRHLPVTWLAIGAAAVIAGLAGVAWVYRGENQDSRIGLTTGAEETEGTSNP